MRFPKAPSSRSKPKSLPLRLWPIGSSPISRSRVIPLSLVMQRGCRAIRPRRGRRVGVATATWFLVVAPHPAWAADGLDLTLPPLSAADRPVTAAAGMPLDRNVIADYLESWSDRAARARETQPGWSSPLITTTGLMEQRLRFDLAEQHAGNGTDTTALDGGRGLDLIVSETNEIQLALPPYDF